jgi:hypothetical protein
MDLTPFLFILASLATYRLTRLWLYDQIAEPTRDWVLCKIDGRSRVEMTDDGLSVQVTEAGDVIWHQPSGWRRWLNDLLTCQWCLGIWVAFGVTLAWSLYTDWWTDWTDAVPYVLVSLALAAAQSFWHLIEDALLGE